MRLRCATVVSTLLSLSPPTPTLTAQQPVRVLRHAPADTARPGDVITISFDRPVAGSLERTPDLSRVVRIGEVTQTIAPGQQTGAPTTPVGSAVFTFDPETHIIEYELAPQT